jgi:hypothetical protein
MAACEKAELEFKKSIAGKQAALKCPPIYKELDSRQDRARLKELAEGKKTAAYGRRGARTKAFTWAARRLCADPGVS